MRLSLTHYDHTITIDIDHDDVTLTDLLVEFEGLLRAAGYAFSGNLEIEEPPHVETLEPSPCEET